MFLSNHKHLDTKFYFSINVIYYFLHSAVAPAADVTVAVSEFLWWL
jgi:hypothetical protein